MKKLIEENGKFLLIEAFGEFDNLNLWKKEAIRLKLKIWLGTHPNGEIYSYWRAKDKVGNDKGYFDLITGKGKLFLK